MNHLRHIILCLLVTAVGLKTPAQPPAARLDNDQRRLLLQFGGAFMNVLSETRIDLDSGLLIAQHWFRIGRSPVITEGLDKNFLKNHAAWIDKNDPATAKQILTTAHGTDLIDQQILLGAWYAFQPAKDQQAHDSAIYYLDMARRESAGSPDRQRKAIILLEKVYFDAGDTTNGLICLRSAIEQAHRKNDKADEARAWNYEASFYPFTMDVLPRRLQALEKALPLYKELKDTANEILCLTYKGYMEVAARNMQLAASADSAALLLEKTWRFPYLHYSEDQLNYINITIDTKSESLYLAKEALQSATALGDSLCLPYILSRLGQFYFRTATKFHSAESWIADASACLEQALLLLERRHEQTGIYSALYQAVSALDYRGLYKDALNWIDRITHEFPPPDPIEGQQLALTLAHNYAQLHENTLAEKYYLEAIRLEPLAQKIRGDWREAIIQFLVANFYFLNKDYAKSRPWLIKALAAPSGKSLPLEDKQKIYRYSSVIDSSAGDYTSAFRELEKSEIYSDSVYHSSELKQLDSIRTAFATAQKEKDNELLRAQTASQQKTLTQDALTRKINFSALALLLIIIGLVVNRYRIKQRTNRQLELQKQEIDNKNQELEKLLASKEWLLSEIHHRVKNNLQIMMNLLNMQAGAVKNEEAVDAIRDSQNRLHAMSLIHQKLYQTVDKQLIPMQSYIREFVYTLHDNFYRGSSVRLDLHLIPFQLDITQAIPLALILNEAVTNAYKYAFTDAAPGAPRILGITTEYLDDGETLGLYIKDNGKGMPANLNTRDTTSLGISLMRGLSEQIHGEMHIENKNGVTVTIQFKPQVT